MTALVAAPALGAKEDGAVGFLKGLGAGGPGFGQAALRERPGALAMRVYHRLCFSGSQVLRVLCSSLWLELSWALFRSGGVWRTPQRLS